MKKTLLIIFISSLYTQNCIGQFLGGSGDGFNIARYNNPTNIFAGGGKDGYDMSIYKNAISIFSGGSLDGYDSGSRLMTFVWTGIGGENWNEKENWSSQIIPHINSKVVIPSGVPNFPNIMAGIFVIGIDPSNLGTHFCKQIIIQPNAAMTLGINTLLDCNGVMEVNGTICIMAQP